MTYNLIALAATLLFLWVIYSQIVVIRHHWSRSNKLATQATVPEQSAPAVTGEIDARPPIKTAEGDVVVQPVETSPAAAAPDPLEKSS